MEFHADTFEEMAKLSQEHGREMLKKGDKDHIEAMEEMQKLMKDPEAMGKWFSEKESEFNSL